ncbi:MAG: hypothetical protein AB1453_03880 [Chloroflexota bacterium]
MRRPLEQPDWELLRQMPLGLEIDESDPAYVTPEEAHLRSETARKALELLRNKANEPGWLEMYWRLREAGWKWRVAVYIAWAASPKQNRQPKTQEELATQVLGLTSDRQIGTWRAKNAEINETIALLQAAPLFEHRADIYEALIASASRADYKSHQDRKLALELLGDYVPRLRVDQRDVPTDDLSHLSDAELAKIARLAKSKSGGEGGDG